MTDKAVAQLMAGAAAAPKFLPPSVPEEAPPCIKVSSPPPYPHTLLT